MTKDCPHVDLVPKEGGVGWCCKECGVSFGDKENPTREPVSQTTNPTDLPPINEIKGGDSQEVHRAAGTAPGDKSPDSSPPTPFDQVFRVVCLGCGVENWPYCLNCGNNLSWQINQGGDATNEKTEDAGTVGTERTSVRSVGRMPVRGLQEGSEAGNGSDVVKGGGEPVNRQQVPSSRDAGHPSPKRDLEHEEFSKMLADLPEPDLVAELEASAEHWRSLGYYGLEELLRRAADELEALRERCRGYEAALSEDVSPTTIDGEKWHEKLPNGVEVPMMRGSPQLQNFIAHLHMMGHDLEVELERVTAENERLVADNKICRQWVDTYQPECDLRAEIIEKLEAQLAEAVAALKDLGATTDEIVDGGSPEDGMPPLTRPTCNECECDVEDCPSYCAGNKARTVLARLGEGE